MNEKIRDFCELFIIIFLATFITINVMNSIAYQTDKYTQQRDIQTLNDYLRKNGDQNAIFNAKTTYFNCIDTWNGRSFFDKITYYNDHWHNPCIERLESFEEENNIK